MALREGGTALIGGGAIAAAYGASQAGAVLRYRLAPALPHEPALYARAVHALDLRETDLAAGLAARIARNVPVTAHVEARVSQRGGEAFVRPAAFLTAGIDDAPLPLAFRARGYAQAGYVGGRDATGFVDGSAVAERQLLASGNAALSAGAGLWGGAQRGSGRLDVGPSASLHFPLGDGMGRVAVDYRLRLAGNAEPQAGAALTLSAGF